MTICIAIPIATSHKLIHYACMFIRADLGGQVGALDPLRIKNLASNISLQITPDVMYFSKLFMVGMPPDPLEGSCFSPDPSRRLILHISNCAFSA